MDDVKRYPTGPERRSVEQALDRVRRGATARVLLPGRDREWVRQLILRRARGRGMLVTTRSRGTARTVEVAAWTPADLRA